MPQYVVVYDRASGTSSVVEFVGEHAADRALEARFAAEHGAGPSVEVAILTAANEDELRSTHSRYFRTAAEMFDDFEKLVAS